jgi:hypothetical protein
MTLQYNLLSGHVLGKWVVQILDNLVANLTDDVIRLAVKAWSPANENSMFLRNAGIQAYLPVYLTSQPRRTSSSSPSSSPTSEPQIPYKLTQLFRDLAKSIWATVGLVHWNHSSWFSRLSDAISALQIQINLLIILLNYLWFFNDHVTSWD